MTFDELKAVVKETCNLTSPQADARIGASINRHYRRVTAQIGLDVTRFVTRSATMTIGVPTVTFASIEKIDRLRDVTETGAIRLIPEVAMHTLRSLSSGDAEPTRWATQSTTADTVTVLTDTMPQTDYDLEADGWTSLADLQTLDTPAFPESFHDVLTYPVIAEELLKKGNEKLAREYERRGEKVLADLRFSLADSHTLAHQQGSTAGTGVSGGGGGGASTGTGSYSQTGLVTFDRDPDAPFAVTDTSAYVPNLYAEGVGNVAGDRLIGRDTTGTGDSEQLTVSGGLAFTGTGGIHVADAGLTYAKLQDMSAGSLLLGRGSSGSGVPQEITLGTGVSMSGTVLSAPVEDAAFILAGQIFT